MITAQEARQLADGYQKDYESQIEAMQDDLLANIMDNIERLSNQGLTYYKVETAPLIKSSIEKLESLGFTLYQFDKDTYSIRW